MSDTDCRHETVDVRYTAPVVAVVFERTVTRVLVESNNVTGPLRVECSECGSRIFGEAAQEAIATAQGFQPWPTWEVGQW